MLVLVTGAAGHLGSAACEQLAKANIDFRATDVRTRRDINYRVQVANLLNREACYQLVEGCEAVVHIANRPNEHAGTGQEVYGDNCVMNMNIFQASLELGVKKIIYASSIQAIIGSRKFGEVDKKPARLAYLPADGDIPACPGNHYSASKMAGEELLRMFVEHRGLESGISMRFPGMVRREWFDWIRRHTNIDKRWHGEYIDEVFAWLTFEDAGRLIVATLNAALPGYRCYMPAHPTPRVDGTIQDLIKRFWATVPTKQPVDQLTSLVDISKITADTGWTPTDDFRETTKPAPNTAAA